MNFGYCICLIMVLSNQACCRTVENSDREKRHINKQFIFHKTFDFGNKVVHSEGSLNVGHGGFSQEKHIRFIKNDPPLNAHQDFQAGISHFGHAQTFNGAPQQFNGVRRDPIHNSQIFFNDQNSHNGFIAQNNHIQNSGVSATKTVEIEKIHSFNIKKSDQFFSSTTKNLRSAQIREVTSNHANNNFDHMEVGGIFGRNPDKQQIDVEIENQSKTI